MTIMSCLKGGKINVLRKRGFRIRADVRKAFFNVSNTPLAR